jgi:hypothetical protein
MLDHRYLINKFPKIELFYDNILHRKVHTDIYILIPNGIKVFAWFTYYKNQNICVIVHLNKYNLITKIENTILSFDKNLSYGTIIYGTYFTYNNMKYISCEDIYYYKGEYIYDNKDGNYIERLKLLKKIFDSELKQIAYTKNFAILGLPFITNSLKDAFNNIKSLPYSVKGVLCRDYNKQKEEGILLNKEVRHSETIFKIKADIQADIYNLYCSDNHSNNHNYLYNIACIPDYKTSVMMNKHFRFIKENRRLDSLEESDEEEEFENISDDKFVNLKKIVYMKCVYVKKFRKWKPIECVDYGEKLMMKREIYGLEK